jgi:hypothetical protein
MAVNDKIRVADYNSIRNTVVNVLGTGSGPFGYGQALNSSSVAEGTKLTVTHITQLRNDIINAWTHIFGTAPNPATVVEGGKVRFNVTDAPVNSYTAIANTINTNRFTVAGSQSSTAVPSAPSSSTWPGGGYGTDWTTKIQCTITATWPTAAEARYFWNSGGQIRITASRSPVPNITETTQNTEWTSILSSAGTQSFGGAIPSTGTSPNDGRNWYRCTNTRQLWYSLTGSSPYGVNTYKIFARTLDAVDNNNSTGTARQGEWHVEFVDDYVDPGIGPAPEPGGVQNATAEDFPPGDSVDGTFTVSVSLLYATGILVPLDLGNFSVTLPTVTISAVAPPT